MDLSGLKKKVFVNPFIIAVAFIPCFSSAQKPTVSLRIKVKDTAAVNALNQRAADLLNVDSSEALAYANSAYNLAAELKYTSGEAQAVLNIADYYSNKNEFALSMSNYLKAIELSANRNEKVQGKALIGLAQIYKDMSGDNTRDYLNKGIEYSNKAFTFYKTVKDSGGMANSLNEAGIIYRDKAKLNERFYYDSAFHNFSKAIELVRVNKQGNGILPKLYNNISQVYMEYYKDYEKTLEYLFLAVNENKRINSIWGLSHNYANIAETFVLIKDNNQALEYARKTLDAAITIQRPLRIYSAYNVLYQVFNAAHKYDSALAYFVKATHLNDSLTNISRTNQVLDLQYKYETTRKELQIKNLSDENTAKSSRILYLAISLITMAAIVIGIVLLYRRVQIQKGKLDRQSRELESAMDKLSAQKNELEELGRVKDKLFSVISHDLKTPVNTLVSFFDLLDDKRLKPEKVLIYISTLKKMLLQTSALMTNLLHWAASQMHGFKPYITKTSVTGVIERVLNEVNKQALHKQIHITNEVSKNVFVAADADMLAVVLRNLVSNAIKYVDAKTGEITIATCLEEGTTKIVVKDNGVGMSKEDIARFNNAVVFDATKSKAGTDNEKGTGLGLMLCCTLVKLMNGKISVSGEDGVGTTFFVCMPAA